MSNMIRSKDTLLQCMRADNGLILEWCSGTRSGGWWWLRDPKAEGMPPHVHASAAQALAKAGVIECYAGTWRERQYRLAVAS